MVEIDEKDATADGVDKRPAVNTLAIKVCLLVGVLLSFYAFHLFSSLDQERLRERVQRGTQTLAATSSLGENFLSTSGEESAAQPVFDQSFLTMFTIIDVLTKMQMQVLDGVEPDQAFLEANTMPANRFTGEWLAFRYMPKVVLDPLSGRMEMLDVHGERSPTDLVMLDQGVTPEPVSDAGTYFPIYLQAVAEREPDASMTGRNFYNEPLFQLILDQARDAGIITTRVSYPLPSAEEPYMLFHYFVPLYTPGAVPLTVAERRERHVGFLSVASFTPAEFIIGFFPESYLGIEAAYILDNEAFHSDNFSPEVQSIMTSPDYAQQEFTSGEFRTHIIAKPSYPLAQEFRTATPWLTLAIGLLLTTWVCSLLYMASIRSSRMSALIAQRTSDLQERTQALSAVNQALSESEMRYRMLADNVSDVIFTCDEHAVCRYISPSVEMQTGFSSEDYLGKPIYLHILEPSATLMKTMIFETARKARAAAVQQAVTVEYISRCRNGDTKAMECSLSILYDKDGNFNGILGVSRDISERKRGEEERARLEVAVQQSQKMEAIGTLAGGVAHDFNNLLTGILGHADLIKSGGISEQEVISSADVIENAAIRAKDLTSQLLGFARKGHFQAVPVDISELINETVALLKRTFEKNISIVCELSWEPLIAHGDPSQIGQIFLNLAVNARDAMKACESGKLLITTSRAEIEGVPLQGSHGELPPGSYCQITFTDTGEGIARQDIDRIFEPFFTSKAKGQGTGLGLAMVYGVTRNHGGMVSVCSELGKGSTFSVYLPLETSELKQVVPDDFPAMHAGHGTVLIVDDEALVRDLTRTFLEKLGYRVCTAEDGLEGLNFYREHQAEIDLVILDLNMPVMGGIECMEKLVELDPEVKIILATGYSQESFQNKLMEPNVHGFLQKPYRIQLVSELLAGVLGQPCEMN